MLKLSQEPSVLAQGWSRLVPTTTCDEFDSALVYRRIKNITYSATKSYPKLTQRNLSCRQMEYGIRPRGHSGSGPGGAAAGPSYSSWLDSAAYVSPALAAYQLPSSSAALLLNSLQSLQATTAAMELAWRPAARGKPPEDGDAEEEEEDDEDGSRKSTDTGNNREDEVTRSEPGKDEEEEEGEGTVRRPVDEEESDGSTESWVGLN